MTEQQRDTKSLGDLLDGQQLAQANLPISGLQLDSRLVNVGDLFLACSGYAVDGRDYIDHAIDSGAVAILVERGLQWQANSSYRNVPLIIIDNLKEKLSEIAGRFYDHPSKSLPLIGVTGTNGKTSCCHLIMQVLNLLDKSCGLSGTLGNGVDGNIQTAINTTPDAVTMQQLLAQWREQGVDLVAMEVSSHGLDQKRVGALQFDVALFTNLSRDHLDYHPSMEAYASAKAELFSQPGLQTAIINIDDSYGEFIAGSVPAGVKVLRYSIDKKAADIHLADIKFISSGVTAILHTPWGDGELHSNLMGRFNLSNVVAVIATLCASGFALKQVLHAVSEVKPVPGRMECVSTSADIQVLVDYAHTPAALEAALEAIRLHQPGQLWCVFGCGGDRDRGKRAQMGAVAERLADRVVVTSDNPRTENAAAIIEDIAQGFSSAFLVEEDREKAIEMAIAEARAGDSILIAGKGHENYQQIGDQRLPFNDVQQARLALAKRVVQ